MTNFCYIFSRSAFACLILKTRKSKFSLTCTLIVAWRLAEVNKMSLVTMSPTKWRQGTTWTVDARYKTPQQGHSVHFYARASNKHTLTLLLASTQEVVTWNFSDLPSCRGLYLVPANFDRMSSFQTKVLSISPSLISPTRTQSSLLDNKTILRTTL